MGTIRESDFEWIKRGNSINDVWTGDGKLKFIRKFMKFLFVYIFLTNTIKDE